MRKQYFVYILASKRNGTLYVGVTSDLARRGEQHKSNVSDSFTKKYHVHSLVYYEVFDSPDDAIRREKNLKAWKRNWKLRIIEETNPDWEDLFDKLLNAGSQPALG